MSEPPPNPIRQQREEPMTVWYHPETDRIALAEHEYEILNTYYRIYLGTGYWIRTDWEMINEGWVCIGSAE